MTGHTAECAEDSVPGRGHGKKASSDRGLLMLKLRNCIARKEAVTACANSELMHGGWQQDWSRLMQDADRRAYAVIKQLEEEL